MIEHKPPPVNPFELRAELQRLDSEGIAIGAMVTVAWVVPEEYGGGTRSHTGQLAYLDRKRGHYEIYPSNKSPGHYRGYLLATDSTLTKADDRDVKPYVKPPENPFIRHHEEKKRPPKKRPVGKLPNPFLKG